MNPKKVAERFINHFEHADRYNQLRPGETHLAITAFLSGFEACLSIAASLKLTSEEFEELKQILGEYFDQFADEPIRG